MNEDNTFRILRRTPYENLQEHLDNLPKPPPLISMGHIVVETRKNELVRHYEMIKCFEKHGWTFEEYVLESEKRQLLKLIDDFNKDCAFPKELVARAKEFFPNARFIEAKIELE